MLKAIIKVTLKTPNLMTRPIGTLVLFCYIVYRPATSKNDSIIEYPSVFFIFHCGRRICSFGGVMRGSNPSSGLALQE